MTIRAGAPNSEVRRSLLPVFAAAADPYERCEGKWFQPVDTASSLVEDRALRWRQAAADESDHRFVARGLQGARLHTMLCDVRVKNENELPPWASMLLEVFDGSVTAGSVAPITTSELGRVSGCSPWPRYGAHEPLILAAVPRLAMLRHSLPVEVEEGALRSLLVSLARRLNQVTGPTLSSSPTLASPEQSSPFQLDVTVGELFFDDSAADVATWIEVLRGSPVLARLVGVVWMHWWSSVVELLHRLTHDIDALTSSMNGGSALGPIRDFTTDLADLHSGGRTVTIVHFASGCRVVYKPRNLEIAASFLGSLGEMRERGSPLDLPARTILSRPEHTWESFVERRECADREAVSGFYRRYGMLARLVELLGGYDFTYENIRADADYPVPIDLETLFRPWPRSLRDLPDDGGLYHRWLESLAPTGMITCEIEAGPAAGQVSASPLAPIGDLPVGAIAESTPSYRNAPVDSRDHFDAVLDGYVLLDRWLLQNASWVSGPDGPLSGMRSTRVRFVHRSTHVYARLLAQSLQPSRLTNGIEREIELERLWRTLAADPNAGPLIVDEIDALRQLDVPLMTCRPDTTSLNLEHVGLVDEVFDSPAFDRTLGSLRQERFDARRGFAKSLLHCADPRPIAWTQPSVRVGGERQRYDDAAVEIARFVLDQSIRGDDGAIGWTGAEGPPYSDRLNLRPLSTDVYSGSAGLAVVIAEVAADSRDSTLTEFTLRLLDLLGNAIDSAVTIDERRGPAVTDGAVGGHLGIGSMVYALARVGSTVRSRDSVQRAVDVASRLDLVRYMEVANDRIATGRPGFALNLLGVARRATDDLAARDIKHNVRSAFDPGDSTETSRAVGWASRELPTAGAANRLAIASFDVHRAGLATGDQHWMEDARSLARHRGDLLAAVTLGHDNQNVVEAVEFHLRGDVSNAATEEVVGRLEVALTAYERLEDRAYLIRARALADELMDRRRTGSWFPDLRLDDRYNLSALRGLGAIALCLTRVSQPGVPRSLRLID